MIYPYRMWGIVSIIGIISSYRNCVIESSDTKPLAAIWSILTNLILEQKK